MFIISDIYYYYFIDIILVSYYFTIIILFSIIFVFFIIANGKTWQKTNLAKKLKNCQKPFKK